MSTAWLKKQGIVDRLAPLRAQALSKEFRDALMDVEAHVLPVYGTRFSIGLTAAPTHARDSLFLSRISKADEETDARAFVEELTRVVVDATKLALPDLGGDGRELRWWQVASLTVGAKENHLYANVQLNYTEEGQPLSNSLKGKFGNVHRDALNDPCVLTAVVSLSHLSEDYFGGRFNITSLNLTTPLRPYEIVLFPGRLYHCSTAFGPYSVPRGSPLRLPPPQKDLIPSLPKGTEHVRLVTPMWSTLRLMTPQLRWPRAELYEDGAEVAFEDKKHHHEWMMHFYILHEPEIYIRLGGQLSSKRGNGPEQLQRAFHTTKIGEDFATILEAASSIPRNGDPSHYVRLFEYRDEITSKLVSPDRDRAVKALEVIGKDNPEYKSFAQDMRYISSGKENSRTECTVKRRKVESARLPTPEDSQSRYSSDDDDNRSIPDTMKSDELSSSSSDESADEIAILPPPPIPEIAKLAEKLETAKSDPSALGDLATAVYALTAAVSSLISFASKGGMAVVQQQVGNSSNTIIASAQKQPFLSSQPSPAIEDAPKKAPRRDTAMKGARTPHRHSSKHDRSGRRLHSAQAPKPPLAQQQSQQPNNANNTKTTSEDIDTIVVSPSPTKPSPNTASDQNKRQEPPEANEEPEYEIEKIIAKRPTRSGNPIYKIRWRGWGAEYDEWKTVRQLRHARQLVRDYEMKFRVKG